MEEKSAIHPIWRGIGCILAVIIPLMAFAAAAILMDANAQRGWIEIPRDLERLPDLTRLAGSLPDWIIVDFYAKLLVAVAITLLLFGILTMIYSLVYRMGGGYRPSPVDAPPIKKKTKRSR
jgi:hypothetical protein